ncbi:type II secretion system F family protein [Paraburkholderia dinghuensis]|uniref:Type II secretion system F family protein n=1 Tax=Paraburkholderia dinghuensis TaxID=2305225 RepID=A0A3N6NAW5_9BURK|nr:type II secretion system F family protein [Paraburkholderia dinghuensis]RQH05477.1 type II secretion system F family protein [Paraburkholderia dinghuensis]
MKYLLHGFDASGELQKLRIDCDTPRAAEALARSRGLRIVSVRPVRRAMPGLRPRAFRFDVDLFARELAALLDAGVGVIEALRTLGGNERRDASAAVYRDLLKYLEEGHSLSAALEHAGSVFPPVLVACVKASEQTGGLADSLARYSRNSAMLRELRSRVVSAAIYPSVLLLVGACVVLFLLGFVVPRFATLLEHSGHELPFLSRVLMAWGVVVHAHGTALAVGTVVCIIAAVVALRRPATRDWIVDRLVTLPGIGPHFHVFCQSQFFRTAAMLVDGGIPAVRAFELARGLVGRADRAALAEAMQRIRNGTRMSEAFQQTGLASAITYRLLTVAEKTGALGPVLDRIAGFQEAQVSRTIDFVSRLVEPVMMIVIGVVIGGIVVLMYMPIFEIASSIG